MPNTERALVVLSERFALATGRSISTVSRLATSSGATVQRLRSGCSITTRRADRALQWLSDHWPAAILWPADIPRLAPSPGSPAAEAAAGPPLSEHERQLAAALALGPSGRIRKPAAVCEALGVSRTAYDDAVKRYRDGGRRGDLNPQKGTWTERILNALVQSGDVRFAARRERLRKGDELARRFGLGAA